MLADENVLTMTQLAWVTGQLFTKGKNKGAPNRRLAIDLIESGAINVVDPAMPTHRWLVWSDEALRFLAEGPRRSGGVRPIRQGAA